jgi:mannose-6-phosphate isomerase-like protein (cupin superfamily)
MLIAPAPPVPIVTVDRPTQVSAYGSGVLFSKRDPARARGAASAGPAGSAQERENLGGMPDYTKLNLREVEDMAPKFGMGPDLQSRFARDALGLKNQGLTLFTLAPGHRIPFGHRHGQQEEVYVIVAGSARVKLEDEIVELATWDALRIPPEVRRGIEAGPDGAELLAVGAPNVGFGDAEQLPDFWPA